MRLIRPMLAAAATMVLTLSCGSEAQHACEMGDIRCHDNVVQLCTGATQREWKQIDDCSDNLDTGFTLCGTFDGEPACIDPTPEQDEP